MNLHEAIDRRYSVRTYQPGEVEPAKLESVLNAGRLAPSGRNLQEWKFVVVRAAARRAKLVEACQQPWMATAPVIVAAVSLDPDRTMFCGIAAAPVDCAIAIDHMTLAAVAEGLGTCWVGHFDQVACCKVLGVPDGMKIIELMTLGVPADSPPTKRRKSLEEIVCYDRYEG